MARLPPSLKFPLNFIDNDQKLGCQYYVYNVLVEACYQLARIQNVPETQDSSKFIETTYTMIDYFKMQ